MQVAILHFVANPRVKTFRTSGKALAAAVCFLPWWLLLPLRSDFVLDKLTMK
jgi:hypothetical protein